MTASFQGEAAAIGPVALDRAGRKELTIRLETGASVAGAVSWDDGTPTKVAFVTILTNFGGGRRFEANSHTAPDGTFIVRGLPPGEISLRALPLGRHKDDRPAEPGVDQTSFTLRPGEQKTGLKLVVRR